eukprot:4208923-Lingulodinium_polyedra.AAC.1
MDGEADIFPRQTRRAILRGFRTFATADGEINPGGAVGNDEEIPANAEAETASRACPVEPSSE